MKEIAKLRNHQQLSQRQLATMAGISYKALQLVEGENHISKLSTLSKIAEAFQYPSQAFDQHVAEFFRLPPNSITHISKEIKKTKNWKILLFNFVDHFRETQNEDLILDPPYMNINRKTLALIASTVETLCDEMKIKKPWWCDRIKSLSKPYFVSGIENLKAMALIESPLHFRKRNIFVLHNFLERI